MFPQLGRFQALHGFARVSTILFQPLMVSMLDRMHVADYDYSLEAAADGRVSGVFRWLYRISVFFFRGPPLHKLRAPANAVYGWSFISLST